MYEDYRTRLTNLSDKLTNVVIEEADPDNWSGSKKPVKELTKDERGDRYWDKKNAAASLTLLIKVCSLIGMQSRGATGENADDDDDFGLAQQVAKAEKEAAAIIERVMKKGS
ncbi:hypothetical protein CDJ04_07135 [Salmonella enterica]|uniref:Uncharacterized protein n=2 Tax=Salmonella enterica TaxID=28901 RepID=A0A633DHD9_SALER|nr:hypothetical protein [Salmonella enterica]EBW2601709.1 hypothetical protein [Salmonella enterica subsp. enterica serovar Poano]EBZ5136771.1 hypothetical protein [Salmonella enterica subsp. enterica serovar Antsalova]ECD6161635.1 hypothetical protein [Salmonella enterica subsp. enterica]ECU7994251.1 hypothetical protein [Salmonella enterica subsp. enterica serovar Toucra]EDX5411653.1 hypothetical protein [Salmonella enterica subsp. enterica serovar Ealing]EHI8598965.1 hypothetical protein [